MLVPTLSLSRRRATWVIDCGGQRGQCRTCTCVRSFAGKCVDSDGAASFAPDRTGPDRTGVVAGQAFSWTGEVSSAAATQQKRSASFSIPWQPSTTSLMETLFTSSRENFRSTEISLLYRARIFLRTTTAICCSAKQPREPPPAVRPSACLSVTI